MAGTLVILGAAAIGLYVLQIVVSVLSTAKKPGLSSIPSAHWTVPYSRFWLLWHRGNRKEHTTRHAAHKKLGPVIRIAPKEISIDCIEGGIQTVYGGNWDKADFYSTFENYGHHPMFSMTKAKPHAERKRMLAHVYTKTFVDNSADLVEIMNAMNQDKLSPLLRTWAKEKKAANVLPLAESYNMDVTTAYIYGLNNATNWIENPEEANIYLNAFEASLGPDTFFLLEFPKLTGLLAKIGIQIVPARVYECFPVFMSFGLQMSDNTKKSLETGPPAGKTTSPIVYNYLRQKFIEANVPKEDIDNMVASEMLDHLHAGHEATGILTTYLMWELTKNTALQDRLIKELRSLRASGKAVESSQLLDDILMETMRLHPAAWGPFPRMTPEEGGQLGKYDNIPPGVAVSASPYTLGRNPHVFPKPDEWLPQRWSEASPEERKEMEKWVWVFGSGSRICIGRHLAVIAMKSMVATVYEEFRTSIAKETDMTHVEAMMALPKGKQLLLHFHPL